MELSKRLQAVADLVPTCRCVADVGTDHGYIPIYLVENHICQHAIAMDINEGPLDRASAHIAEYGFVGCIDTKRSDGVLALTAQDAEVVVIAGMGGGLMIKMMEEGVSIFRNLKAFVLQPQSELVKVRRYLQKHGYKVLKENMIEEDGKFYPMMQVVYIEDTKDYAEQEFLYGRYLIQEKNPVLMRFLRKEIRKKEQILLRLEKEKAEHIQERRSILQKECALAKVTLMQMKQER